MEVKGVTSTAYIFDTVQIMVKGGDGAWGELNIENGKLVKGLKPRTNTNETNRMNYIWPPFKDILVHLNSLGHEMFFDGLRWRYKIVVSVRSVRVSNPTFHAETVLTC